MCAIAFANLHNNLMRVHVYIHTQTQTQNDYYITSKSRDKLLLQMVGQAKLKETGIAAIRDKENIIIAGIYRYLTRQGVGKMCVFLFHSQKCYKSVIRVPAYLKANKISISLSWRMYLELNLCA